MITNPQVGMMVTNNRSFFKVPEGTDGIISEFYDGGVMVTWAINKTTMKPEPFPECIKDFILRFAGMTEKLELMGYLTDGFSTRPDQDEMQFLDPIGEE